MVEAPGRQLQAQEALRTLHDIEHLQTKFGNLHFSHRFASWGVASSMWIISDLGLGLFQRGHKLLQGNWILTRRLQILELMLLVGSGSRMKFGVPAHA